MIQGYHATLNQQALGLGLIMLDSHSEKAMNNFEAGVMALPNVVACHNVSGKYDYLLQVVVQDMEAFHRIPYPYPPPDATGANRVESLFENILHAV